MTIYSLYIFDRHCACVYYHDWQRTNRPKPAVPGGGIMPGVSRAVTFNPAASNAATPAAGTPFSSPRNTLSSSSGVVVAVNDMLSPNAPNTPQQSSPLLQSVVPSNAVQQNIQAFTSTGLPFDEEAKLVYGVILSLRNMVKKLSGKDSENFVSFKTSAYKLHLYETPTNYRFVMLTDPGAENLRFILRQIYVGPFIEYVVRNPLIDMDSKENGIDNEYFRASLERMVRGLSIFQ
ncbi:TRAPP complex subunit bet5 [Pterulicium gracile]|uniref:Trafficking protein particle complex subunit n=1 Tax=Pterulicium gracile TaxID=1884261 RepID=A0A5C3QQZ1_9AGAR|nr:TRAPP complex subunit bet5 [Pterula gracilis]